MVLNALNKVNWMYVSFLHLVTITDVLCFRINNISHNPMWIEAMWIIMQYFTDILRHKVQELKQYSIKRILLIEVIFFQSLKMKSTPFLSLSVWLVVFLCVTLALLLLKGPHTRLCFELRLVWSFFMVFTWLTKYVLWGEQELFLNNWDRAFLTHVFNVSEFIRT